MIFARCNADKRGLPLQDRLAYWTDIWSDFWRLHPALLYSIALLFGFSLAFIEAKAFLLLLPLSLLLLPAVLLLFLGRKEGAARLFLAFIASLCGFVYINFGCRLPDLTEGESLPGEAIIAITAPFSADKAFKGRRQYRALLYHFRPFNQERQTICTSLPVSVYCKAGVLPEQELYQAVWLVKGSLSSTTWPWRWKLQLTSEPASKIASQTLASLAPWRIRLQEAMHHFIGERYSPRSHNLLSGLITGQIEDRMLNYDFARFGLQHILAISGFHFSLISAFIGFFLALCLPYHIVRAALVAIMTLYLLFIGATPSTLRAWVMLCAACLAPLFCRIPRPLNLFGFSLGIVLLYDPFSIGSIGFQFSFLITAALLCFSSTTSVLLEGLFKTRPITIVQQWTLLEQIIYLCGSFFKDLIALGIAVNIVALPLILYQFNLFPLMTLFYNLFLPPIIAIILALFFLCCLAELVLPPLGFMMHRAADYLTYYTLGLVSEAPPYLDLHLHLSLSEPALLIVYFTALFSGWIFLKGKSSSNNWLLGV